MHKAIHQVLNVVVGSVLITAISGTAEAGPPLICHPFDAGSAALLPWGPGQGWNAPDRAYDVQRLPADTLRLLTPTTPVLARMEIMRRATIYASQNHTVNFLGAGRGGIGLLNITLNWSNITSTVITYPYSVQVIIFASFVITVRPSSIAVGSWDPRS